MSLETTARHIVQTLTDAGHTAYYAGGWVRDKLLGVPSADIDIASSATPDQVCDLFDKTIPVGISFGSVIVVEEGHSFEVTTFRTDLDYTDGRRPDAIEYSSPEEDAMRRSFTINGLFWDPLKEEVIDFVGGRDDLARGVIKAIGEPAQRFKEDKLRMIRAVRFCARLGFTIEKATENAIIVQAETLFPSVAIERIVAEFQKAHLAPNFPKFIAKLQRYGLLEQIFPELADVPIATLTKRIEKLPQSPLILVFCELLSEPTARLSLCRYLKSSGRDIKLTALLTEAEELLEHADNASWARFYAEPDSNTILEVIAARQNDPQTFLNAHHARQQSLEAHIKRIELKEPLITSTILKNNGIPPSPLMGQLLQKAEEIAINQNLHDPTDVLTHLKNSPLWPPQL